MKSKLAILVLIVLLTVAAGCAAIPAPRASPTPTVDPDIYNKVPVTTVFDPGQCTAVLASPAPAYTSSTLGGPASGEIKPGEYEVGLAADYGSSLWYALNNVGTVNWINSKSVSSLSGDCATKQ